ncbi:hypothetical protein ACFV2N_13730 [Streptomyces sp. NPDC059680]|uniref:hypothetical protein n=1 Tax=Streptomyces sp. NPDC059680 TaxID=3346904 RepID=UPI0036CB9846
MEGNQGTDDERWNEFVSEFEKSGGIHGGGIHEPGAAERETPAKRPPRRKLGAVTAVVGAVAVVAGAGFWLGEGHGTRHETAAGAAGHAPSRKAAPAEPSTASMPMVTEDQAFPAHVGGYTKVMQTGGPNCTGAIGPNLAGMIRESKGCRGVIGALYRDASDNQYTIVAFGMKDRADVVRLVTLLSMNQTDHEVPVLTPPAGSGLKTLPADSGLVQAFAGQDALVVAGLAQWADGHADDYPALVDRLQPLMDKVRKVAGAHDRG